ncbi:MAG: GNAT family N-acetyltransferase, partial [Planctomycetales bacterium]|nr:GNAT family N-acetyltransferase [Planctomycetales bacterium]
GALVNQGHNRRYDEERGFFGFFESIDDEQVAHGLFDAAKQWHVEQGMTAMRGPTNPSLNYECGLLIEGFDDPPFFMMTYNPPFYQRLVESYGFQKSQDLYAYYGHVSQLDTLDEKLVFITQKAKEEFNVDIRPISRKHFNRDVRTFLDIYNRSLAGTWGFVPLSDAEIDEQAGTMRYLIEPELALMAEVDGKPIGAVFGLLDYNTRIKQIDGKLFPFGFLKLLRRRQDIKRFRMISTNVVPEYQKWGIGLVLLAGLIPKVLEWGLEHAEFSWVLESNNLSRKSLEKGGTRRSKAYRIYDLDF